MKYYKLKQNFDHYGQFFEDVIYPETYVSEENTSVMSMVSEYTEDWTEVKVFKFGRNIYER